MAIEGDKAGSVTATKTVPAAAAIENDLALPVRAVSSYEATARNFTAPAQQSAVLALAQRYSSLPDLFLYTLAHDTEPVGPRIGETQVPESTLRALAMYEWTRRVARREHRRWFIGTWIVGPLLVAFGWLLGALFS